MVLLYLDCDLNELGPIQRFEIELVEDKKYSLQSLAIGSLMFKNYSIAYPEKHCTPSLNESEQQSILGRALDLSIDMDCELKIGKGSKRKYRKLWDKLFCRFFYFAVSILRKNEMVNKLKKYKPSFD